VEASENGNNSLMSHIQIRKIVSRKHVFAGHEWWYLFGAELQAVDQDRVKRFINSKQQELAALTKSWNDELNTEWVCRVFFAAKMVLAASVMLESLEYSRRANLRICVPYLQYYSILYSLKALVLVLPSQIWGNAKLVTQTHKATINVACVEIAKFVPEWTHSNNGFKSKKDQILALKAFREWISYRAPSNGGAMEKYNIDILPLCKLSVETAQIITELLENSLLKHLRPSYAPCIDPDALDAVWLTQIGANVFEDDEDRYRIDYLKRKHPIPTNIMHIISEGHADDFFGSWCDHDEQENVFDPDENRNILFQLP
jgi:hypothetical protein